MPRLLRYCGRVVAALALCALAALSATDAGAVATTPRYAHVAALMVDGRTIVAGGLDSTGTPLNTVEILDTLHGAVFVIPSQNSFAASMHVARASATITVLPNANILVTGGFDGTGPRSDVEVYNPTLNGWTQIAGMTDGRMDHTATLLNNGSVLICGGQKDLVGTVSSTCDLFTPTNGTTCLAAGGCLGAGPTLLLGRARHTSTLLSDGTVWIAGGWNPVQPSGGWVVTTERYYPSQNQFQQAQPLNEARGYHTATLDGDNKVIVAGGFNGLNRKDQVAGQPDGFGFYTTRGIIGSTEIFDPTGGAIVPGPPMQVRLHKQAAALQADGQVVLYGGLSSVTSTKLTASNNPPTFGVGSWVSGTVSTGVQNGYTNIPSTSGAGSINLTFYLDTPVTGQIIDGEVDITSGQVTLGGAYADFVTGDENIPAKGLRASLQGVTVGCEPTSKKCGYINTTVPLSLVNMGQGGYHIAAPIDQSQLLGASSVSGTLNFTNPANVAHPDQINSVYNSGTIVSAGSSFSVPLELTVSALAAHWQITNVNCQLTLADNAKWSQASTYTVTLNGGTSSSAGPYTAQVSGAAAYIDIPSVTFTGLSGSISYTGLAGNAPLASGFSFPTALYPAAPLTSLTCSMDYTSSGLTLDGGTLKFDSFYALVRDMVASDYEFYAPSMNQWSYEPVNGSVTRPSTPAEGAVMIHMPWDDLFTIGGRYCTGGCAGLNAAGSGSRQDFGIIQTYSNFSVGGVGDIPHAYHSANLLSDGTILLAGGTDGSYVLPWGEVYDPVQQVFTSSGMLMHTARQQHSANLLPNGRVLLAGGFATTAASTGPTNTAELYYPDTRVFLNTSLMVSSHSQHAAIGLPNGNVFIAGGYNNLTTVTNVAEVYYATSGAWGQLASMPAGRAIAPAVQLQDGRILICGGTNQNGHQSSCAAYSPATNLWNNPTTPAPMPTALQGHTMTLMADGRVLVTGGDDGFGETTSSYLYDPVGNSWLTTNPLIWARFGHDATLLPNGEVMISGGVGQVPVDTPASNARRKVEFYHPLSAQWSDGGGASQFNIGARSFHTATLAPNGNVYFFGGANGVIGASQATAFYTKFETDYFTGVPDGNGRVQPSLRQSSITFVTPSPFLPGATFTAGGLRFRGATEGSGGASASGNPSFNYPRLVLQKIDGGSGGASESSPGFVADLTTLIPANSANLSTLDNNLAVTLPASNNSLPYGWYMTWVGNNDVHSQAAPLVLVGPNKPTAVVGPISVFTQGTSSINYTWSAIAGPLDGYEVFAATTGVFLTTIPVSGSPSFMQTNLLPNTTSGILVAGYTLTGDGPLTSSPTSYTLPNPPTGLFITSVTFNTLALMWSANQNLAGTIFEVGESSDNFVTSFSTPVPEILGLTNTFVTIQNLQPNTTYFFRVRAYNSAGLPSSWTTSVSTLTRTSVAGVTGVAISPTSIQWNWLPAGAVINYKVYNSTTGQVLATPLSNSFLDTGLGIDTQRAIQVSAITPAGEGPLSSPTTVYTFAATPAPVPPALLNLTTGSFTLQWAPNGNPNGIPYSIILVDYSSPTAAVVTYTTVTAFTIGFGNLKPSDLFLTEISAVNGDGFTSVPLIIGSTYTFARPPTNLQIVNTTPVSLSAAWSTNSNSTNTFYQVTYSTDNFIANISTAIDFAALYDGSTVTINGLLTSTTYWVRVVAENPYGQVTQFSNVVATITYNGGAPLGSVAGVVSAIGSSEFYGNLGNGRTIDIRSPGGSFPTDTTITISSYDATVPLCPGGLNLAVSLVTNPSLQPTVPIYFKASYSPAELGTGPISQLVFERYEPVSGTCVPLQTTFDTTHQTFTAQMNHFSFYELVSVPLATDTNSLRIFPNPYRAATDSYITFDQIPPGSRVRVMTLRGETVMDATADGSGLLTWNASNGSGRSVASGLYIVVVESGGSKKVTKLAVIR